MLESIEIDGNFHRKDLDEQIDTISDEIRKILNI